MMSPEKADGSSKVCVKHIPKRDLATTSFTSTTKGDSRLHGDASRSAAVLISDIILG
jgi:hypothetical protein